MNNKTQNPKPTQQQLKMNTEECFFSIEYIHTISENLGIDLYTRYLFEKHPKMRTSKKNLDIFKDKIINVPTILCIHKIYEKTKLHPTLIFKKIKQKKCGNNLIANDSHHLCGSKYCCNPTHILENIPDIYFDEYKTNIHNMLDGITQHLLRGKELNKYQIEKLNMVSEILNKDVLMEYKKVFPTSF